MAAKPGHAALLQRRAGMTGIAGQMKLSTLLPAALQKLKSAAACSPPPLEEPRGERFTTLPMSTASTAAGEAAKGGLNGAGRPKVGVDTGVGADTSGRRGMGMGELDGSSALPCCSAAPQPA